MHTRKRPTKSALKAGYKPGPRSPTRISARDAALPSGFYLSPTAKSMYQALSMKERDTPTIRIAIGEMSAGLLSGNAKQVAAAAKKIAACVDSTTDARSTPRKHVVLAACRSLQLG